MGTDTTWLRAEEAAQLAKTSRRGLVRLVERGLLARQKDAEGVWTYNRADCLSLAQPAEAELGTEESLLAQAQRYIESLTAPARMYAELMASEMEAQRRRITELEGLRDAAVQAREELLDAQVERDMAVELSRASSARKDKAFALAVERGLPLLLDGKSKAAAKLFDSLTEDQVQLLLDTDLTTPDQKNYLRHLVKVEQEDT